MTTNASFIFNRFGVFALAAHTIKSGISSLDKILSKGIPRNNLIIIAGEAGTAKSVMLENLAYNFLNILKEPIIFVTLDKPAYAIEQEMASFGWCLEPFVKKGLVRFVGCFSFRMESKQNANYVEMITNPRDIASLTTSIFQLIDKMNMNNKGAVFFDSLTELLMLESEKMFFDEVVEGIKTWRARGPIERGVLFFATYHLGIESLKEIEQSLSYVIDGIIDLRLIPEFFERGVLGRELRVRKMRGVPHDIKWVRFGVDEKGITERVRKR